MILCNFVFIVPNLNLSVVVCVSTEHPTLMLHVMSVHCRILHIKTAYQRDAVRHCRIVGSWLILKFLLLFLEAIAHMWHSRCIWHTRAIAPCTLKHTTSACMHDRYLSECSRAAHCVGAMLCFQRSADHVVMPSRCCCLISTSLWGVGGLGGCVPV